MTSRSFPYTPFAGGPGAYCDALPSGEFVAFLPGERCETHLGAVEFLDQELQPLFPRINPKGPFEFAAVGWEGRQKDHVLVWDGQWHVRAEKGCGANPVIYDYAGQLHVSHCQEGVGSQGYRYVTPDNHLVTGDETYSPTPDFPLAEGTRLLPDLAVGQGAGDDGVHVLDRGQVRTLATNVGLCRFVRAYAWGNRAAVSWWGQGTHTAEFRWLSVEELRALPLLVNAPPTPPPLPPPPVEVPPMRLPDPVRETVRAFAAAYPVPKGDGSEEWVDAALRQHWTKKLAEQLRFSHGEQWGAKARDAHAPRSKESIAWNSNGLHVWDMLTGAGSGNPSLALDPEYHFVPDQHFIPMEAVDRLNRVASSGVGRPPLPFLVSKSSFDWHIHRDREWLEQMKRERISTLRLVAHSVYRESGRVSPDEAIKRLRLGLAVLRSEGMTAAVTFHADTRERGDTKATVATRTRQINDVLRDFPDVVLAARLWNENSHSVEQWFACDPDFLAELDALVDPRFPLAWGAAHGGESISPRVAGGSWIAHHSDRSKSPEENAAIMAAAQERYGKPVVDDEPIGFDATAQAGRRVNDPQWARRQAEAAKVLGGSTLHCSAGIPATVATLDDIQREAGRIFGSIVGGGSVTPEEIATVFAGAFFEDISILLQLDPTASVAARRPAVHAWIVAKVEVIDTLYREIFSRPCDLEGFGSRILLYLLDKLSDADLRAILQKAYANGDR